jgi:hypothetical protein
MMMIGLALVFCLAASGWASSASEMENVQITGTVMQGGLLVDDQGQEYQMTKADGVLDLEGHVGQKIEVKGTLMENTEGQKVITIEDYKVINE